MALIRQTHDVPLMPHYNDIMTQTLTRRSTYDAAKETSRMRYSPALFIVGSAKLGRRKPRFTESALYLGKRRNLDRSLIVRVAVAPRALGTLPPEARFLEARQPRPPRLASYHDINMAAARRHTTRGKRGEVGMVSPERENSCRIRENSTLRPRRPRIAIIDGSGCLAGVCGTDASQNSANVLAPARSERNACALVPPPPLLATTRRCAT